MKRKTARRPDPSPAQKTGGPGVSIIIPTYNEVENLPRLIREIRRLKLRAAEILVVDDNSPDGTALAARQSRVRTVVRTEDRGLSQAVAEGFRRARGEWLLVMDADLSHPPRRIPALLDAMKKGAEVAVGSRYSKDGELQKWPLLRRLYSLAATVAVRPLTGCQDPMAGFFCVRRDVLERGRLVPRGYKILLEILVRCRVKQPVEVPIVFTDRQRGKSKLNLNVQVEFVRQLLSLYKYRFLSYFLR